MYVRIHTVANNKVKDGDGSSRLDYASTEALSAGTGYILRASASPITPADLTLPAKGTKGSLSWSSEVLVDTTAITIENVSRLRHMMLL